MKFYEDQKNSIYKIQKLLGLTNNYLYHYAKRECNVKNMNVDVFLGIAKIEKIDPFVLYNKMQEYYKNK